MVKLCLRCIIKHNDIIHLVALWSTFKCPGPELCQWAFSDGYHAGCCRFSIQNYITVKFLQFTMLNICLKCIHMLTQENWGLCFGFGCDLCSLLSASWKETACALTARFDLMKCVHPNDRIFSVLLLYSISTLLQQMTISFLFRMSMHGTSISTEQIEQDRMSVVKTG